MARVKFGRDGERGRKALDIGNCSINIWDGSEKQFIFRKNFPIFLLFDISNTLIFKVHDVLHLVNF